MKTCVFGGTTDDSIEDNISTITTGNVVARSSSRSGGRSSISAVASRLATTPTKKLSTGALVEKQKRSGEFPHYYKRNNQRLTPPAFKNYLNGRDDTKNINNKKSTTQSLDRLSPPSTSPPPPPPLQPPPPPFSSTGTCRYQRTAAAKCNTAINASSLAAETLSSNSLLLPPPTPGGSHKHIRRTSRVINNVSC